MATNNFTVEVEAKITVSDETANTCLGLLNIYCDNKVGVDTPCRETCEECAVCQDGYCYRLKAPVYHN